MPVTPTEAQARVFRGLKQTASDPCGYAAAVWQHWEFLCAEVAERQAFRSLESTLALPGLPAAPPNRLREVRRIATATGTYYLKIFHRTQTKNRLRFAITRPRARSDAQREALITAALRQHGIETPRPVALGHRGPSSFYLCAEMRGRTLRDLLQRGQ